MVKQYNIYCNEIDYNFIVFCLKIMTLLSVERWGKNKDYFSPIVVVMTSTVVQ